VTVYLYNTSSGLPTGAPLASVSRPFSDVPVNPAFLSFDFSSAAQVLTAGTKYAFVVGTGENEGPCCDATVLVRVSADSYADGQVISNTNDILDGTGFFVPAANDLIFNVNGVPSP
jgi:hypothetical protein